MLVAVDCLQIGIILAACPGNAVSTIYPCPYFAAICTISVQPEGASLYARNIVHPCDTASL